MKLTAILILSLSVLLTSCKHELDKKQIEGEWTVVNIDYDSTLKTLKDQEFKRNMAPYLSLYKFKGDSMDVLSIDKMQEQIESVFYEIINDTIISKVYLSNEEMKAFPNRKDNYYFNKFKIEKIGGDSMILKSFYHLKKLQENDKYEYSLDSNYYTAKMVLRKINSMHESGRIGWFFINEKVNQVNNQNSKNNTENDEPNTLSTQSFSGNSDFQPTRQYGFVVMKVRQENDNINEKMDGINFKDYVFTTGIKEYGFVDEDTKYQILDEAQASYKRTADASVYKGTVKDRELQLFSTYEQASKAREKYTMSN